MEAQFDQFFFGLRNKNLLEPKHVVIQLIFLELKNTRRKVDNKLVPYLQSEFQTSFIDFPPSHLMK